MTLSGGVASGVARVYTCGMSDAKQPATVPVTIRLPREFVAERVDALAERMRCDRGTVLRAAVIAGIEEGEQVAEYAASVTGGALLLASARVAQGREGFEKMRQFVESARRWKRGQQRLPFVDREGGAV